MVAKRTLPERHNHLVEADASPAHEELAKIRRLGQTTLAVKAGAAGLTNASKAENTGAFDYAHLRVPLPKDLAGSGIFTLKATTHYPESYFLMRRSSDGFISSTGMFKAAFPWASIAEEEAERKYQKTFPSAGPDEVAGSVWIAPEEALQLSDEYGMRHWIVALLDPSPIEKVTKDRHNSQITQPPIFDVDKMTPSVPLPPDSALRATRARSLRSASPSKIATPSRKMASPRKSRATRSTAKSDATSAEIATSALNSVLENGAKASESVASESINGEAHDTKDFHIHIEEKKESHGDVETTTTKVDLEIPSDVPELRTPEDPSKLIEEARRMVKEARELDGGAATLSKASGKRKAELLSKDENELFGLTEERPAKQAKTAYTTEQKLTKEKMTRRALVGLTVMAAIGTAIQYLA